MDEIKTMLQNKLLEDNKKILYLIIYGCGGVMFVKHFYSLIGKKDTKLIQKLTDSGIIKIKKIGRNNIVIARHSAYSFFGLENKSVKLTSNRILHSALICEMLSQTYFNNIDKILKILQQSNFRCYSVADTQNFLNRVYCFMNERSADTSNIKIYLDEIFEKTEFLRKSTRGRKEVYSKTICNIPDLLTLRNNDIYIHYADYINNTLQIHLAIFSYHNSPDKVLKNIKMALDTTNNIFFSLNYKVFIDIYSLYDKSEFLQKKVFQKFIDENIKFHWYNVRNKLFSGIDIDKWL